MQQYAPIVLFVYNRPSFTKKTLQALSENTLAAESELFIYADGVKEGAEKGTIDKITEVRKIIREKQWCKEVHIVESEKNNGLAASVIRGVSEIVNKYGSIIVLEDDMITSPYFLKFMNDGLSKYKDRDEVISIHGYSVPIDYRIAETFFLKGADCWGWATWQRGWQNINLDGDTLKKQIIQSGRKYEFDFNGTYPYFEMLENSLTKKVDSWAILWYASAFVLNKLTLYPYKSLVNNIGYDNTATHKQSKDFMNTDIYNSPVQLTDIPVAESADAKKLYCKYFFNHMGIRKKIKRILRTGY